MEIKGMVFQILGRGRIQLENTNSKTRIERKGEIELFVICYSVANNNSMNPSIHLNHSEIICREHIEHTRARYVPAHSSGRERTIDFPVREVEIRLTDRLRR